MDPTKTPPQRIALPKRFRRFTDCNGMRIGTTGIPLSVITDFLTVAKAGDSMSVNRFFAETFAPNAHRWLFAVPAGESPETPSGCSAIDLADADADTLLEIWNFVSGMESQKDDGDSPLQSAPAAVPAE